MTEPTPPHFYQAIGTVYGILEIKPPNSTLTIEEQVFPARVKGIVQKRHQPGQVELFRFYPQLISGQIGFHLIGIVAEPPVQSEEQPIGQLILNGCWELEQQEPYFIVYRNEIRAFGDGQTRTLVPVVWDNAPTPDGQFWQARATWSDGAFAIAQAHGPFEPPPKATTFSKNQHQKAKTSVTAAAKLPIEVPPLSIEEIKAMSIPAKVQLACKINQVPPTRTLPDGRMEFFLNDGERILTVRMKQKTFKKLKEHGFTSWVATISGTLGEITETGFELANASVQVFEKKEKEKDTEAKPEETKEVAVSSSDTAVARQKKAAPSASEAQKKNAAEKKQQPQVQDDSPVAKKKRLLQGIDVR